MFMNIYVTEKEARKFGDAILVNGKGINFSEEQIEKHMEAHENVTKCFRDIEGNAYVIMHGIEFDIDGNTYGYVLYHGETKTASYVYEKLVKDGFIKDGEKLNIICCHGAGIKDYNNKLIANREKDNHPIEFVNDTHDKVYCTATKMKKTGLIRMSLGTQRTFIEKLIYKIGIMF